jgi:type I restriction enzyme M protein
MHSLYYLSKDGTASIVCFPGIMYRGGSEQLLRKYIVENNYVDTIIQLPDNLFFGTTISTYIMVLKKNRKSSDNVLFINASDEYRKETNNNRLMESNIDSIYEIYRDRKEIEHKSRLVQKQEIAKNDYSLNLSLYVKPREDKEIIDINQLNTQIKEVVSKEDKLRKDIDAIIKMIGNGNE